MPRHLHDAAAMMDPNSSTCIWIPPPPPTAPCSGLQDRLDRNVVGLAFVSNDPAAAVW